MDGLRDQFLARAAFAVDEDAAVGAGHERQLLPQGLHGHALADDAVAASRCRRAGGCSRASQAAVSQCVFDDHRDLLDGERLFQKIEGAELGGADGRFDVAVARNDDHHGPVRRRGSPESGASVSRPSMPGSQISSSTSSYSPPGSASRHSSPLPTAAGV